MNRSLGAAFSCVFCVAALLPLAAFADGTESGSDSTTESRASMGSGDLSSAKEASNSSTIMFEKASAGDQSIAAGHFARSRSLLIAALNEFDAGVRRADPSSLIDTGMFREGIKARARELERVLDPQARESETGVKFNADSRLLKQR